MSIASCLLLATRQGNQDHNISVTLLINIALGYAFLCAGFNFLIFLEFKCNSKLSPSYKVFYHAEHLPFTVG